MTPKWTQNGAKKRLWTQIGATMTLLGSQCDLEIGSRDLEVASCDLTLLHRELKASKPSKKVFQLPQETPKEALRHNKWSGNEVNERTVLWLSLIHI